ncbi:MAG: hypothetical protein NC126_11335 [Clostridium sp.]|nr:hypothetical protein [Clostridium sp.]
MGGTAQVGGGSICGCIHAGVGFLAEEHAIKCKVAYCLTVSLFDAERREVSMKKQQPYVNKKHLPMMGVGPVYVAVIIAVTVIAVIVGRGAAFEKGRVNRCIPWPFN